MHTSTPEPNTCTIQQLVMQNALSCGICSIILRKTVAKLDITQLHIGSHMLCFNVALAYWDVCDTVCLETVSLTHLTFVWHVDAVKQFQAIVLFECVAIASLVYLGLNIFIHVL